MSRPHNAFVAITSTGGLLPTATLERLVADPDEFPHTAPGDYGLIATKKVRQAINQSWSDLLDAWREYRKIVPAERPDGGHFTDQTIRQWIMPLLQTLGWEDLQPAVTEVDDPDLFDDHLVDGVVVNDRVYDVTHEIDGVVPVHMVGAGVPLDRRTQGVRGASRQAPFTMVQTLLNASEQHLWAVLTNGETLRLLRDTAAMTRDSYVEFDLATMFDNEVFSDFVVLWMVCHRSRFPQAEQPAHCVLEDWQDTAAEHGVEALAELRGAVRSAIAALATGLMSHPANHTMRTTLSADLDAKQDLYRQCLRTVYQWLFLLVLEDMDLLHSRDVDPDVKQRYLSTYGISRLRQQARVHLGGDHPDGWEQWQTLRRHVASPDGLPALGVPSLYGGMFDSDTTPLLDGTKVTNRALYAAVRALTYLEREGALHRINFRNLGSRELGSVYESLLELQPDIDLSSNVVTVEEFEGNDRKQTGAYYTPDSLVKVLLDEAVDPVVNAVVNDPDLPDDAAREKALLGFVRDPNTGQITTPVDDRTMPTTVCDPAMGSAHFLVGAGHRLARHVAVLRSEGDEPAATTTQQALRDVVANCLYGVDINPMAVEIAKIALWLECHTPGQPLTFLDHHLKVGNALLGVGFDTSLLDYHRHSEDCAHKPKSGFEGGIPTDAFTPSAGDDKKTARAMRDQFKAYAGDSSQMDLFAASGAAYDFDAASDTTAEYSQRIGWLDDANPDALDTKQRAHMLYGHKDEVARLMLRADAYIATWTMNKTEGVFESSVADQPYHVYVDTHFNGMPGEDRAGVRMARRESDRLRFFHWSIEYPEVARQGGFDIMLGNPPWERVEVQQKDFFAQHGYSDIANARTAAIRKKMVNALAASESEVDLAIYRRYEQASHDARTMSVFLRKSGRYPTCGTGNVDTYAVFAEHFADSVSQRGRTGIITPSALLTGFIYRDFFASLVDQRRLVAAFDFENRKKFFPEVDSRFRFCTLVATAPDQSSEARFAFVVHDPAELAESERTYRLSSEEIALVNPNTKTAPVFLTSRDAQIATDIYRRHPVIIEHDAPDGNPWNVDFKRMFEVHDSGLFHTADELQPAGWTLAGNIFERDGDRLLPLYEGKFFGHFDHREKDYSKTDSDKLFVRRAYAYPFDDHADPSAEVLPRHWVAEEDVDEALNDWERDFLLSWSDVTAATNHRTTIAALLPRVAANHKCLLAHSDDDLFLLSCWTAFAFDWVARQKMTGTTLSYYIMEQLPIPAPETASASTPWSSGTSIREWTVRRAAALSASSHLMADALGYDEPVVWNENHREVWRTELDAAMFHIYGYSRDDVEYVMGTFPIVAKHDREAEGLDEDDPNWRTKRLILAKYEEFQQHADAGTTYEPPIETPPLPKGLRQGRHRVPAET